MEVHVAFDDSRAFARMHLALATWECLLQIANSTPFCPDLVGLQNMRQRCIPGGGMLV
jgi:hypothetical protein